MPALSIKGKLVSGGTDASELTQKINNINDSISNILGDFATIEPAAIASKPYEIGERLVLNGLYYKVTAAISQGNALVVNGNIEKTTVGDDITALNKDLSNYTQIGTTGVFYRKWLHIVEFVIAIANITVTNQGVLLATLPNELRPTRYVTFPLSMTTDPSLPTIVCTINTDGTVTLSAWSTVNNIGVRVHHCYLV